MSVAVSVEQRWIDGQFESACDLQNEEAIQALLRAEVLPSQKAFDKGFVLALATCSLSLIRVVTETTKRIRVSDRVVDESLVSFANEGVHPSLIGFLQEKASPQCLAEQQRYHAQLRRDGKAGHVGHYLVAVFEPVKIKELKKKLEQFAARSSSNSTSISSANKHSAFKHRLANKAWINDGFLEATRQDAKLLVETFLNIEPVTMRPSMQIINEAFVSAILYDQSLSMAMILSSHISQDAIDTSFSRLLRRILRGDLDELDMIFFRMLTDGQLGVVPDQQIIDEFYYRFNQQQSSMPLQQQKANRAALSVEHLVSEEAKTNVRREKAKQKHASLFRQGGVGGADIHAYSAVRIQRASSVGGEGGAAGGGGGGAGGGGGRGRERMYEDDDEEDMWQGRVGRRGGGRGGPRMPQLGILGGGGGGGGVGGGGGEGGEQANEAAPAPAPPRRHPRRTSTLNGAVLDCIERRVDAAAAASSSSSSSPATRTYTQEDVHDTLSRILTAPNEFTSVRTYTHTHAHTRTCTNTH